jgi:hypothetical protein
MAGVGLDESVVDALGLTGRERFTNHAEWVSVTTGRWWHLPSSLRFLVSFTSILLRLMQPEWTQHPDIWHNIVLSRPSWPAGKLSHLDRRSAYPDPQPQLHRPHARHGRMHLMQLRALSAR